MDKMKPYLLAIVIQVIYTGLSVISKSGFDHGMNPFVFIFYRQVVASLVLLPIAVVLERQNAPSMPFRFLLKLFLYALIGNTFSLNIQNVSIKFTSATVASAIDNSMPVATFCLALLLRMQTVKLKSSSGVVKLAGMALCLAGILFLAFYSGPPLSPLNRHHPLGTPHSSATAASRGTWIMGTFLMVLACVAWSLWIVLQAALLKEYPNKMLVTATQCVFSVVQTFLVAVVAQRDFSMWKLRLDVSLLAVLYSGFVVTGVSYYLQAWCMEMKGPVFLAIWAPLCFVFTIFSSYFFLEEAVHLGSIVGDTLLSGGLISMLWGKSKETRGSTCHERNIVGDCVQEVEEDLEQHEEAAASALHFEQV